MAESFTNTELILWMIGFSLESLAIIVGNTISIVVFWKQRSTLKRTSYLLINLSIADLMVGVGVIDDIVCLLIRNKVCKILENTNLADATFGIASLSLLVLIALERLYAIVWPLRHRSTKTSTYFYVIGATWIVSAMLIMTTYPIFSYLKLDDVLRPVVISMFTATCLIVMSVAYLTIFVYSTKEDPRIAINRRQQNKKLAKTLFIVTLLSVITWIPHGVTNILRLITGKKEGQAYLAGQICRLANSSVNPIIYSYRMPEFRKTLRNVFACKGKNRERQSPLSQLENNSWLEAPAVLLSFTRLDVSDISQS